MTDQSFFTSLPTSSHDTALAQIPGGGHSAGIADHQFGAAASTKTDYDLKLATGTSSNNEITQYGGAADYHRNSPALKAALQTLQNFGNGTEHSTKDTQFSALATQNRTSLPTGLVMMARSTEDSDDDGSTSPKQSAGVSDNGDGGGVEASGGGDNYNVHPPVSDDGGGGGYIPPSNSSSDDEHISVHGNRIVSYHGYKAEVLSTGTFLLAPNGKDFATYTAPSGAHVPIKVSDLDQDLQKDFSDILGSAPSEQDYENAYKTASNGGSPDQVRRDIAFSDAAAAKVNDLYSQVLGRGSDPDGLKAQQNAMASGQTLQDIRWSMAHSAEEVGRINDLYRLELGRQADAGGSQNYQDAIGNGRSLNDSIHDIAYSPEARTQQIDPFLRNNVGNISGDLEQSAATVLNYVSQAVMSIRDYSQDQIQSLATNYQNTFALSGSEGSYDKLVQNNWISWVGLAATLAISMTPPGEAVAVGEILVSGGEEILGATLDNEISSAAIFETKGAISEPQYALYSSQIEKFENLNPKNSGTTVVLDDGTSLTQNYSTKYQKRAMDFTGANEQSVENIFRNLTGIKGPLDPYLKIDSDIGKVYTVKTEIGNITYRTVSGSGKDWTIDLPTMSNGVSRLKFSK